MFSSSSYRVLLQSFLPQNISLLPKIVTEAHANLKKKKTSCNTTLKHYTVMVHQFGRFESFQSDFLAGSIFFHLLIINSSSKFTWTVVHYYIVHIFPQRSIIL